MGRAEYVTAKSNTATPANCWGISPFWHAKTRHPHLSRVIEIRAKFCHISYSHALKRRQRHAFWKKQKPKRSDGRWEKGKWNFSWKIDGFRVPTVAPTTTGDNLTRQNNRTRNFRWFPTSVSSVSSHFHSINWSIITITSLFWFIFVCTSRGVYFCCRTYPGIFWKLSVRWKIQTIVMAKLTLLFPQYFFLYDD